MTEKPVRNFGGPVCIALGAVVLDTPDRSGCYVARDMVGGWSYLISDGEGDYRFQGAGTCPGGIDAALRWALLAALAHVPECRHVRVLVENRQVHRAMVRLAQADSTAINGIAGRAVAIFTRPEERSVRRATSAAEQAAAVLLRNHERNEAVAEAAVQAGQHAVVAGAARRVLAATATAIDVQDWEVQDWRVARAYGVNTPTQQITIPKGQPNATGGAVLWMTPMFKRVGQRLAAIGLRRKPQGNTVIAAWMKDLDMQVATVRSGLEGLGT